MQRQPQCGVGRVKTKTICCFHVKNGCWGTLEAMSCDRGRCPCWPQAEPFDAAEMALAVTIRAWMHTLDTMSQHVAWLQMQAQCRAVRPQRRAYLLSMVVKRGDSDFLLSNVSLIGLMFHNPEKVQWLLNEGVCPNIAMASGQGWRGWSGGIEHPGRPPQTMVHSVIRFASHAGIINLLLRAGAYPLPADHLSGYGVLRRQQWHRWHGRASRRLWAATAC